MSTAMVLLSTWIESQVELWMPIEGYPRYDVSNFGRVRGCRIKHNRKGEVIHTTPFIMRPQISVKHAGVTLSRDGRGRRVYVHRLVAKAFLPNPENLPEVNHITAYPADNRVDGLEWASHLGNHQHAKNNGLHAQGGRNGMATLTEAQVLDIRRRCARGERRDEIAKEFRLSVSYVSQINTRHAWSHI